MRLNFHHSGTQKSALRVLTVVFLLSSMCSAQAPHTDTKMQREAMQKLAFLEGRWSGPVSIIRGPGETLRLRQAESIYFKLGGLVLLIEGQSTGADGSIQFEALATVAYDSATRSYRIRSYHDGHYLDTTLSVLADGFSWEYASGPARIVNAMHLTTKGEWQETTTVAIGDGAARPSVEMLLEHQ